MNKTIAKIPSILLAILLVSCTPDSTGSDTNSDSSDDGSLDTSSIDDGFLKNVDDEISVENAQEHIEYLAGNEIGGRASGSADNQKA
ncbi:MAG: hypothetical protein WCS76_02845, partial [Bacilli bacterium]